MHWAVTTAKISFEGRHKGDDAVFGNVVGAHHLGSHQACHGGSRVDMTFLLLFDERKKHVDSVNRTPQADINNPLPVGELHRMGRCGDTNPRVVTQHVNGAILRDRGVRQSLDLLMARDIAAHAHHLGAAGFELCHCCL